MTDVIAEIAFDLFKNWGAVVSALTVIAVAPTCLVAWLLWWVVKRQERLDTAAEERERVCRENADSREARLLTLIEKRDAALADHNKTTIEFRDEVKRTAGYQRAEHESIIGSIKDLTGALQRLIEKGR